MCDLLVAACLPPVLFLWSRKRTKLVTTLLATAMLATTLLATAMLATAPLATAPLATVLPAKTLLATALPYLCTVRTCVLTPPLQDTDPSTPPSTPPIRSDTTHSHRDHGERLRNRLDVLGSFKLSPLLQFWTGKVVATPVQQGQQRRSTPVCTPRPGGVASSTQGSAPPPLLLEGLEVAGLCRPLDGEGSNGGSWRSSSGGSGVEGADGGTRLPSGGGGEGGPPALGSAGLPLLEVGAN